MWTSGITTLSNRPVVLAEYDSRHIFGDVLRTHVRVYWDMLGARSVMGVLVVAHIGW